jgi:hypothetical protein
MYYLDDTRYLRCDTLAFAVFGYQSRASRVFFKCI